MGCEGEGLHVIDELYSICCRCNFSSEYGQLLLKWTKQSSHWMLGETLSHTTRNTIILAILSLSKVCCSRFTLNNICCELFNVFARSSDTTNMVYIAVLIARCIIPESCSLFGPQAVFFLKHKSTHIINNLTIEWLCIIKLIWLMSLGKVPNGWLSLD